METTCTCKAPPSLSPSLPPLGHTRYVSTGHRLIPLLPPPPPPATPVAAYATSVPDTAYRARRPIADCTRHSSTLVAACAMSVPDIA
eukprot:1427355-Rhodomonas_salina.1